MFVTREVSTPEVDLHLAIGSNSGPPLLFLHGVCRRWQDFLNIAPVLSLRWQLHGLDFRGHGGSKRTPGKYCVADYVRDALAIVRSQFEEPAVIFGHSLGALVAAAVAAQEPTRVKAIVLEDPPSAAFLGHIERTPYLKQFAAMHQLAGSKAPVSEIARKLAAVELPLPDGRVARLGDLRDATALRFMARCLQDLDPDLFAPILERRWLDGYDTDRLWRNVRCPALLLRADETCGGMLPGKDAEGLMSLLADGTRIDIPKTGHLIHWMEPEQTVRLVNGFLEGL